MTHKSISTLRIQQYHPPGFSAKEDQLAIEEPLEIRLGFNLSGKRVEQSVSITMRTPGHDRELATGFLLSEGFFSTREEIQDVIRCEKNPNIVRVLLKDTVPVDAKRLQRHFYTTSSCGVCGKASLELLQTLPLHKITPQGPLPLVQASVISLLPQRAREAQVLFHQTGGLHAAALFDTQGRLLNLKEDVGRHNAMDKLLGEQFLQGSWPLQDKVILLSGRASWELMQKATVAQIPVVAAVGAPSSLAVEVAKKMDMTLLGFVRGVSFNIYHGEGRLFS